MSIKRMLLATLLFVGETLNRILVRPYLGRKAGVPPSPADVAATLVPEKPHRTPKGPTGDVIEQGYEPSDVNQKGVLLVAIGIVALAVVMYIGLSVFYFHLLGREQAEKGYARTPEAIAQDFPPPRLQPAPPLDLAQLRTTEEQLTHQYGWVNRQAGMVRIPIERAMELTAARGVSGGLQAPAGALADPYERAAVQQASASLSMGSLDIYGR